MLCISDLIVALCFFCCVPFFCLPFFSCLPFCCLPWPSMMLWLLQFQLEQSIVITEDTLYLGLIDLETDLCHGKLLMRTVKPVAKVNRKRGLSSTRGGSVSKKKLFVCKYCDYKSNAKYMTDRHVARVQEKSVEPEVCEFCQFSSLYAFNIKRHIMRSHPNRETQVSDSSICNLRRSKRSRVIELSESSSWFSN